MIKTIKLFIKEFPSSDGEECRMYNGIFPAKKQIFFFWFTTLAQKGIKLLFKLTSHKKNSSVQIKFSFVNPKILMKGIQICKEITKIETMC